MTTSKQQALKLIRQAQGILEKVALMISEDNYCPDIIQQADAANGLVHAARKQLLAGHLEGCLTKKLKDSPAETIKELMKLYQLNK